MRCCSDKIICSSVILGESQHNNLQVFCHNRAKMDLNSKPRLQFSQLGQHKSQHESRAGLGCCCQALLCHLGGQGVRLAHRHALAFPHYNKNRVSTTNCGLNWVRIASTISRPRIILRYNRVLSGQVSTCE